MHALALSDIDADRQVTDPQAMLIEHCRHQHVGQQMTAVFTLQRPLTRLFAPLLHGLREHCLGRGDFAAIALTQVPGPLVQLLGRNQRLKGQAADRFGTAVAQHAFGASIERADHATQIGSDDGDLSRRIQHTAQLIVGITQRLLTDAQLASALLDQGQGALTLAEQTEQQGTEQYTEQTTQKHHGGDCRRAVGLHERQTWTDIELIVMVGQVQQMTGGQR
ncbi:hypothetical protein D3C72_1583030 [compost metagenome]